MKTKGAAGYWSAVAPTAAFSHPLDAARLARHAEKDARVLDVGCGWGRTLVHLRAAGWTNLVGVDSAEGMLARGREEHPGLDLRLADGRRLPFPAGSFDVVVLFAVLTTVPRDDDQRALVREIGRVLAPGGLVYASDLLLNTDARNLQRYEAGAKDRVGPHGCFRLEGDGGAVCRHHDPAWIDGLFAEWEMVEWVPFVARTMNGHLSNAFQLFARRRTGKVRDQRAGR